MKASENQFPSDSLSSPSASWIDIDNDGDEDLYILNGFATIDQSRAPQKNKFYLNDGQGNFSIQPDHSLAGDLELSGSSTWGDYDNDGDVDVFVANQEGKNNFLFRNNGDGSFTRVTEGEIVNDGGNSFSAVWVDIDNDSWIDLHVMNGRNVREGEKDFLYRNLGDGNFERVTGNPLTDAMLPSGGASWGDYDNDGDQDVIVPVMSPAVKSPVFRNDGDWNFTDVTEELNLTDEPLPYSPRTSTAHWVDYDNDTDLDLFIGNVRAIDYLYENDGNGNFTRVTAGRLGLNFTYVSDVIWNDFDNDSDLDYVIAVWGAASEYYENNGSGEFYPVDAGEFGMDITFASSVSSSDIDNDGDLDLLLTQWPINRAGGAPNLLYVNESKNSNWLKVKLVGTESNRSAIGAKIIITTTVDGIDAKQLRYVNAKTSWRSADSFTQHFGLGNTNNTKMIEVMWPSGNIDKIEEPVSTNQYITIKENEGTIN